MVEQDPPQRGAVAVGEREDVARQESLLGVVRVDRPGDSVADGFMSSLHDSWVEMWASTLHIYAGTLVVVGTGTVLGTSIEAGNVSQLIYLLQLSLLLF